MKRVVARISIAVFGFVAICVVLLVYYEGSMWEEVGSELSPSGDYGVYEYQYMSDGDRHAPYGRYLYLASAKSFRTPKNGYLIFAGHCNEIQYSWGNENEIELDLSQCPNKNRRTVSIKAYGIQINVE